MNAVRIVAGCVLWACALGIAVDLVTAHVAVEYFTVHHPKVVESQSPLVMAFVWGVGASWWFGLGAGLVVAWAAGAWQRSGAVPKCAESTPPGPPQAWGARSPWRPAALPVRDVLRLVGFACAAIWAAMMVVLVATYLLALLVPHHQRGPTFESDRRIMAVAVAHLTEYAFGSAAVVAVVVRLRRMVSARRLA